MKSSALPLTICILTHRADERFFAALESAQCAQHVLILDHDSNNNWKSLTHKWDFSVHQLPTGPLSDFAAARNRALEIINTEWVLFLDSDEVITPTSSAELKKLLTNGAYDAYRVTRVDEFLGKRLSGGEATISLIRLMRTRQARFVSSVHERAEISGTVGSSDIVLVHHAHQSVASFLTKVFQYAQMAANQKHTPVWQNTLELVLFPPVKFFVNFCYKGGWRDGWRGLVYATVMSLHSLFVRVYRYEKSKTV